jgi:hypothetical protein
MQELRDRLSVPLDALRVEVAREFPDVRVTLVSGPVGSAGPRPGFHIGLSCLLPDVAASQPDLVDLVVSLTEVSTTPRIVSADVCWGHPSGRIELEVFSEPVDLTEEALATLEQELPRLGSALKAALRRGRPSDPD